MGLYITFNLVVLKAFCKMPFSSYIGIEEPKSQHVQLAGKARKRQNFVFCSIFTACETNFWGSLETQVFLWTLIYFFKKKDKPLIIWVRAIWDAEDVHNQISCPVLWPTAPLAPSLHKPTPERVRLWPFWSAHYIFLNSLFTAFRMPGLCSSSFPLQQVAATTNKKL